MKISNRFLFILFISFSFSFNAKLIAENKKRNMFFIDVDNIKVSGDCFFNSMLYKNVKTILLETNEMCLIGTISKIRVFDQYLFILDRHVAKCLFVFDKEGHFIRKIGNIGSGPGEYVSIYDFTIDRENKSVFILDNRSQRINKYEIESGRFINSIRLKQNIRSNHIEYAEGKIYTDAFFGTHSNNNYLLRIIQESSGIEEKTLLNVIEYHKSYSNTHSIFQREAFYFRENRNLIFVQPFMDHIIEIKKDSIYSFIDFKGKNLLTSEDIKRVVENSNMLYMSDIMKINKYFNILSFIEKGNWILIDIFKGMNLHKILINKKTNEVSVFENFMDDLIVKGYGDYSLPLPEFGCVDEGGVYYFTNDSDISYKFGSLAKDGVLSPYIQGLEDLKKLDEEDNPILFYYEFKN